MKNVIFEAATFQDAIAKAYRIAPTKGAAYDKASGIVIDVDPARSDQHALIIATNLEVSLRMEVRCLRMGDEAGRWRLNAKLAQGLAGSLPIGSGSEVELRDIGDKWLYAKCGKTKAKLLQVTGPYPIVEKFDDADLVAVPMLAQRLNQVAWATDRKSPGVLGGVHLDGERAWGCNRSNIAVVPCRVNLDEPITAPLLEIASVIKNTGEVMLGCTEHKLLLMPDPHTQATCTLIKEPYPDLLSMLQKAIDNPYQGTIGVRAPDLLGAIDRTLVLMNDERLPSTSIEIGDGTFKMTMNTDSGLVIDELEVAGGHQDEPYKMQFSPQFLRDAIYASGREIIQMAYGPDYAKPIRITDEGDFTALMMPMRPT